jgi:hypothetical protein
MINHSASNKPRIRTRQFSLTACQIGTDLDLRPRPKRPHVVGETRFREDMQRLLKNKGEEIS